MRFLAQRIVVFAFVCANWTVVRAETPVTIVAVDGAKVRGTWVGLVQRQVEIETEEGRKQFDLHDLMTLEFPPASGTPREGAALDDVEVRLADGGLLRGALRAGPAEHVALHTPVLGDINMAFGDVAGVRVASEAAFPAARELFVEALNARLPGQDVMITRGVEDTKALRGRLVELGTDGGRFVFADKERTFQPHRLFGVVFAAGPVRKDANLLFVRLHDGTAFGADPVAADGSGLQVRALGGLEVKVPLDRLTRVDVRSPRLVYVSDLTPTTEKSEARLNSATPVQRDRAVVGGPLRLGGVSHSRGVAMTSRTEVTYDLNGDYSAFAATVGIDDAVRPQGAVQLMIIGDGTTLLDTGTLTGVDEPRDVSLSVHGVKQLTLVTDYGDGIDLSDHADWAGARLLKKATATGKRQQG